MYSCGNNSKVMAISFKRTLPTLLYSVPLTLHQATVEPCLHWRLLDTHRQVWVNLLWGHCSFLLGPYVHKVLFVPSVCEVSVSPDLCKLCNQIPLAFKVKDHLNRYRKTFWQNSAPIYDKKTSQIVCIEGILLLLFSRSVVCDSLRPQGLWHARLPCPSPSPRACSNSFPLSQ